MHSALLLHELVLFLRGRGRVVWGLGLVFGTLLGPERTRILCLSVIGHQSRMYHLALVRMAFAVVLVGLIVL